MTKPLTPADARKLLTALRDAEHTARHDPGRYNSGHNGNSAHRRDAARQALASAAEGLALGLSRGTAHKDTEAYDAGFLAGVEAAAQLCEARANTGYYRDTAQQALVAAADAIRSVTP